MQQAMNNSSNMNNTATDKSSDQKWMGKTQTTIERGISDLKNLAETTDIKTVASDLTHKARDLSGDFYRDSVSFVKRYPVSSALGLAAVGFFAGVLSARRRH